MSECTACQGTGEGYAETVCLVCLGKGYLVETDDEDCLQESDSFIKEGWPYV